MSYSWLHDFGTTTLNPTLNDSISDWGAIHTAVPNGTGLSVHVHHNKVDGMRGYALGGYGMYFDYGCVPHLPFIVCVPEPWNPASNYRKTAFMPPPERHG